jgi:hypothetical protein
MSEKRGIANLYKEVTVCYSGDTSRLRCNQARMLFYISYISFSTTYSTKHVKD